MKRAARVDANQPSIVEAFRKRGATVQHLHTIGQGCPDILVGYRGKNYVVEIKDPNQPPSKRRLTPDEQDWFDEWNGKAYVVETTAHVTALLLDL